MGWIPFLLPNKSHLNAVVAARNLCSKQILCLIVVAKQTALITDGSVVIAVVAIVRMILNHSQLSARIQLT